MYREPRPPKEVKKTSAPSRAAPFTPRAGMGQGFCVDDFCPADPGQAGTRVRSSVKRNLGWKTAASRCRRAKGRRLGFGAGL